MPNSEFLPRHPKMHCCGPLERCSEFREIRFRLSSVRTATRYQSILALSKTVATTSSKWPQSQTRPHRPTLPMELPAQRVITRGVRRQSFAARRQRPPFQATRDGWDGLAVRRRAGGGCRGFSGGAGRNPEATDHGCRAEQRSRGFERSITPAGNGASRK